MKKTERLNGIIFSLKENGRMTANELATKYEVSERTIYRDIDALSQLEVPIITYEGLGGGYEILDDYFIPSISLNKDEAILMLMILQLGDAIKIPNYKSTYEMLKDKIKNTLTVNNQKDVDLLLNRTHFYVHNILPTSYSKGLMQSIITAFISKKQIEITYASPASERIEKRHVSLQKLFFENGGWYVTGYCHLRHEKRTFRLDRIKDIVVTVEVNRHLNTAIHSVNDKFVKRVYEVSISHRLYQVLKDNELMLNSKIIDRHKDLTMSIETGLEDEMMRIALCNPAEITILSPKSFVDKVKHHAVLLEKKYS